MFEKKVKVGDEVISESEWKRKLASDEGLFKRIKYHPPYLGPQIKAEENENEKAELVIEGDLLWMEKAALEHATPFQRNFYDELEKADPEWANEYLLTIVNAIEKWKEDIKILENFISMLKEEEHIFEEEEYKVRNVEELRKKLPSVIAKHLPNYFK